MPIRVRTPDGEIAVFPDGTDDATITRAMRQLDQEREAGTRAGANGPGGVAGAIAARAGNEGPRTPYARAYQRRAAEMRARTAPTGNPIADAAGSVTDMVGGTLDQMGRNMGYADDAAYWQTRIGQGAENLVRRATGRPVEIPSEVAAQAAQQYERDQQQRVARERPGMNAASYAASVPAFGGLSVPGRVGALQAGVGAAATNAPFALARQEGDTLQERLPGAALETGAVFGLGTTLQAGANFLTRNSRPANSMGVRTQQFDDAGVRPTLAAVGAPVPPPGQPMVTADAGGMASITKAIAENPIAGFPARQRLRASLGDTARGAERIARGFGPRSGVVESGQGVQEGLRRWAGLESAADRAPLVARPPLDPNLPPAQARTQARLDRVQASRPAGSIRNYSAAQRSTALYDDFEERMADAVRRNWTARGQQAPVLADETRIALDEILGEYSPGVSQMIQDDELRRVHALVSGRNPGGTSGSGLRYQDLRGLRQYVRRQQARDPSMRLTLDDAALERLESALTRDIYATVSVTGGSEGQELARRLALTDRFYRRMSERLQGALRPFLRDGVPPEQAYRMVVAAASEGGSRNIARLEAVRRSLQPDEWRSFVATVVDEMGRARAGHPFAAEGAFSVSEFASRYANMSDEGVEALFGSRASPTGANAGGDFVDLRRALDNLARVAGMQKAVERAANTSNSAVVVQTLGSLGGLANPQTMPVAAGLLAGMTGLGEAMTNAAFVRWLTSASQAGATPGGMRRHIAALAEIAARDPAVAPVHAELVRRVTADSHGQESRQQGQREPAQ